MIGAGTALLVRRDALLLALPAADQSFLRIGSIPDYFPSTNVTGLALLGPSGMRGGLDSDDPRFPSARRAGIRTAGGVDPLSSQCLVQAASASLPAASGATFQDCSRIDQ